MNSESEPYNLQEKGGKSQRKDGLVEWWLRLCKYLANDPLIRNVGNTAKKTAICGNSHTLGGKWYD